MSAKTDYTSSIQMYPLGDAAVVVQFGNLIAEEIYNNVQALAAYLDNHPFQGLVEYVPAFTTVTIFYNPWVLSEQGKHNAYEIAVNLLKDTVVAMVEKPVHASDLVVIPVCYGGEYGPDLAFVAAHNQLTIQEVISIHSGTDYFVYMIGFAPGFPYLGGMNNKIATPRKDTPRNVIPAGSVGIAGSQTGIYSIETPGGWQLIGRTPLSLFTTRKDNPTLLKAGSRVRFAPISEKEYLERSTHEY
jgi:inhibitor of KinA